MLGNGMAGIGAVPNSATAAIWQYGERDASLHLMSLYFPFFAPAPIPIQRGI
jgi:hypothetical protein